MVLQDDLLGRGHVDLLVATMSGNVFCFATQAPYHPAKSWTSQTQALNTFSTGLQGIFFLDARSGRSSSSYSEGGPDGPVAVTSTVLGLADSAPVASSRDSVRVVSGSTFRLDFVITDVRNSTREWLMALDSGEDVEVINAVDSHSTGKSTRASDGSTATSASSADVEVGDQDLVSPDTPAGSSASSEAGRRRRRLHRPRYEVVVTSNVDLGLGTDNSTGVQGVDSDFAGAKLVVPQASSGFVVFRKVYDRPGVYSELLPSPKQPFQAMLTIRMVNEHKQVFEDHVAISFNEHFYRLFKYLVVGPFVLLLTILAFTKTIAPGMPMLS